MNHLVGTGVEMERSEGRLRAEMRPGAKQQSETQEGRLRAGQRSQVGRKAQGWRTEPGKKEGLGLDNGAR